MELAVASRMFRVFGWAIGLFTVLGLIIAGIATLRETPVYESQSRVLVRLVADGTPSPNDLVNGNNLAKQKASTYADVVSSSKVLKPVISVLRLSDDVSTLSARVSGVTAPDSPIVTIKVEASDAASAAALASSVTSNFVDYIQTDLEKPTVGAKSTVRVDVLEDATTPTAPSSPNPLTNLGLGLVGGLLVGAIVALALALTDRRLRSVGDIERVIGRPILGAVGASLGALGGRVGLGSADSIEVDESLRSIRTNLTFVGSRSEGMTFVVTSSLKSENSTIPLIGIAKAFAEIGAKVVIVDSNFGAPKLATMFDVPAAPGLIDSLISGAALADITTPTGVEGLDIISTGTPTIDNPSRLLGTPHMKRLIVDLAAAYDVVLFDVAPVLVAADAAMLSSLTNGVVMVAGVGRVNSSELSSAIEILTNLEVPITGIIVTKWQTGRRPRIATSSEAVMRVTANSAATTSNFTTSSSTTP